MDKEVFKVAPCVRPTCIIPKCGKPAKIRGLCRSCYGMARYRVEKGETSWDELVDLGLVLRPMFSKMSFFEGTLTRALKEAKEGKLPPELVKLIEDSVPCSH